MITAAIFDLDGVLLDSERLWDEARERLVRSEGGRWHEGAQREMMGMSSPEWSRYLHDELGVALPPDRISDEVVDRMTELYRRGLPLIAGAREAVERVARHWPLAVASSSNRPLIDLALEVGGLDRYFSATVSSEEVARGKPAPDVYSRRPYGSRSSHAPVPQSRIRATASLPRVQRRCVLWRSRTPPSRPTRRRSRRPTSS